jgi:hypothetical protein
MGTAFTSSLAHRRTFVAVTKSKAVEVIQVSLLQILTLNFWILYSLLNPALIEDTHLLQDYLPSWMNHALHSYVLVFTAAELLLCCRHYPRWTTLGRFMSIFVVLAYASWWVRRHIVRSLG